MLEPANNELKALLEDFGNQVGLRDLAVDRDGHLCLSFDEILVNMEAGADGQHLTVHAKVGALPMTSDPRLMERLHETNYANAAAGLGVVALDRDGRQFDYIDRICTRSLTQFALQAFIEQTIRQVEFWRRSFEDPFFRTPAPIEDRASLFGEHRVIRI